MIKSHSDSVPLRIGGMKAKKSSLMPETFSQSFSSHPYGSVRLTLWSYMNVIPYKKIQSVQWTVPKWQAEKRKAY